MVEDRRAIIVEKNTKQCESLVKLLELQRFTVLVVNSPVQALSIVDQRVFQLAFVECDLEGMHGAALAYQLKIKNRQMVMALMSTGKNEKEITEFLRKARLTQYFAKPFREEEIIEFLEKSGIRIEATLRETPFKDLRTSRYAKSYSNDELAAQIRTFGVNLRGRNLFDILGIDKTYSKKEIQKAYYDLSKMFHPDLLQSWLPKIEIDIARNFYTSMTVAYDVLSNSNKRRIYESELAFGTAQESLLAQPIIDQGVSFLKHGNFPAALEKFEAACLLTMMTTELHLYCFWAQLEMIKMDGDAEETLKQLGQALTKLKNEKVDTAEFNYVMGLYHHALKDLASAKKFYELALVRRPGFVEAQRKLQLLFSLAQALLEPNNRGSLSWLFKTKKSS